MYPRNQVHFTDGHRCIFTKISLVNLRWSLRWFAVESTITDIVDRLPNIPHTCKTIKKGWACKGLTCKRWGCKGSAIKNVAFSKIPWKYMTWHRASLFESSKEFLGNRRASGPCWTDNFSTRCNCFYGVPFSGVTFCSRFPGSFTNYLEQPLQILAL